MIFPMIRIDSIPNLDLYFNYFSFLTRAHINQQISYIRSDIKNCHEDIHICTNMFILRLKVFKSKYVCRK